MIVLPLQAQTTNPSADSANSEQNNTIVEIEKMNSQVVKLYNEKKIDEALAVGKNVLETAAKANLTADARVLPAIRNLAELYLAKGKSSEAISVLQIVLDSYEKIGNKAEAEKSVSRLAFAYANKKDYKNAEIQYLKLKDLAEAAHGEKSLQAANVYLQIANFYNVENKFSEADSYYQKAILSNDAILKSVEESKREDVIQYQCFNYHLGFRKNNIKEGSNLFAAFDKKRGFSPDYNQNQGIVNGKAVKLVVPHYPDSARAKRATGFAIVRVEIDEQGNVTKAKAYCGFLDFVEAVEDAALKSKFSPTLKNGVPVEVRGDIVYNFVAR